jgi:hypothetical protein
MHRIRKSASLTESTLSVFRYMGLFGMRGYTLREMHAYERCTNFISSDKILYYQEQIVVVVIFIALILA